MQQGIGNADQGSLILRRRTDLEFYPQQLRARNVWVVKDPLTLRYFHFREEEIEILRWLDGQTSLEQIKQRFETRFAPQRMTVTRLHAFVANLHRNSLVISDAAGQGTQMLERAVRRKRDKWIAALSSPLAIQFPGFDPEWLLTRLYPRVRWLFTPWCVAACALLAITALLVVGCQFDQFQARLPELNSLVSPRNLVWLAVVLALTKLLHEFGHALACKHYGGDCHEMGIMLLVFTPCLYCNVSDAWKIPARWKRIVIAAAGIYVEVILASICVLLWWFSQPGLFNTLCLNVVVVCSVGTVLLNGNPLLRYDGYYILSDALQAPNLWQDSRARVARFATRTFWGFDPGASSSLPGRGSLLWLYAIASMMYRLIVISCLLYLVYRVLKPMGLSFVFQIIAALVVVGIVAVPLRSVGSTLSSPIQRRRVKPMRVALSSLVIVAVTVLLLAVPLPCRIVAPVTIQPLDATRVYVSVPGELAESLSVGDRVQQGDVIARLENVGVQSEFAEVDGQWRGQQLRVRNLESLRVQDGSIASQLPAAREILADLALRREQLQRDLEALSLRAPVGGTVIAPPSVLSDHEADRAQLRSWVGTPLDPSNVGCHLERRTLLCLVGQPDQFEAVCYIDQSVIQYIERGQRVRLKLDILPGKILQGTVEEISQVNVDAVPAELAVDQQLASRADGARVARPEETSYQAHVRFDAGEVPLVIGATGGVKISVAPQSIGTRLYRFLSRTFKPVM